MIIQTAMAGALAATLTATPAVAPAPPVAAHERHRIAPVRVVPTQAAPPSHVVQPGDTVAGIAGRYGLKTTDVLTWNGLSWRSVIYPGQTLSLRAAASAPTPAPATTPAATKTHTVAAGDTVFGIAGKYGTSVSAILAANGLSAGAIIYPGQKLTVSGTTASTPAPAAAPAAAPETSPQTGGRAHTVAAGETLFSIAQRYGTTTQSLFAWNGLDASSIIYPGQRLAVQAPPAPEPAAAPTGQRTATLTAEQAANAALIIRVGRELGVSDRGIAIALATGMVESDLRNLDWGDRDSLGIFQQRPSTGWGTPAQIMDAERSTRVFYGGAGDPNGHVTRGLLDIPGWESLAFTDAAQAVQISAYPDRYGQWEAQAYAWLAQHG
ncbi:LysM peptidoglycan-binding domain-containing protein [Zhihengliuella sp. ISTPL4]|uniref:LysM peptidoglycan-binding domain-containing protein n=1 Tax=Zhihengliuella sp. ISTPL4 TaxID=2058657 RepID=UPI00256FE0FC|nr:LysM peptidoglycan-binding domain-containing protein [Zhihengliuella sp. ISTPL4]